MDPLPSPLAFFLVLFSGWINRQPQALILREEKGILRAAYGPRRVRLTDDQRRPGRPSTKQDLSALVVRLANENPTWGYTRIRGALQHLGHDVARNTIKAILKNHGIEPAPERRTKTPWKTFLATHWDGLAAADFFTVEVVTWRGLVRFVVFFVMKLKTRTVEIAGITSQPHEPWMTQMARNLTDPHDGFLRDTHFVILDRDPLYTAAFRHLLMGSGVNLVRLPARSPNLNAFASDLSGRSEPSV